VKAYLLKSNLDLANPSLLLRSIATPPMYLNPFRINLSNFSTTFKTIIVIYVIPISLHSGDAVGSNRSVLLGNRFHVIYVSSILIQLEIRVSKCVEIYILFLLIWLLFLMHILFIIVSCAHPICYWYYYTP